MGGAGAGPEAEPYDCTGAGCGPYGEESGTTATAAPHEPPPVVVVMGVSGTGKTTVGRLLADRLGVPYAEADVFHPPANVAKMSAGTPLDDGDRAPWLDAIGAWARGRAGRGGVVSCSALKRRYRDRLRAAAPGLFFLHLTGDRALVGARMRLRRGHFMPVALLESQFAALEPLEPDEAGAAVPVGSAPEAVAERSLAELRAWAAGRAPAPGGELPSAPGVGQSPAPGAGPPPGAART